MVLEVCYVCGKLCFVVLFQETFVPLSRVLFAPLTDAPGKKIIIPFLRRIQHFSFPSLFALCVSLSAVCPISVLSPLPPRLSRVGAEFYEIFPGKCA